MQVHHTNCNFVLQLRKLNEKTGLHGVAVIFNGKGQISVIVRGPSQMSAAVARVVASDAFTQGLKAAVDADAAAIADPSPAKQRILSKKELKASLKSASGMFTGCPCICARALRLTKQPCALLLQPSCGELAGLPDCWPPLDTPLTCGRSIFQR